MNHPQILGRLNTAHGLLNHLLSQIPAHDVNRRLHPDVEPLGWLFGRSMYLETHWLSEIVAENAELARRIRHLFACDARSPGDRDERLPPRDHLLNWALEIQDRHLTLLANPRRQPAHPWLTDGRLPVYLVQVHAKTYERMLAALTARALTKFDGTYRMANALDPRTPVADKADVLQGHYRIGARDGVVFDNETPTQVVELSSFRIAVHPVSNAEYLAFMLDGGYSDDGLWTVTGLQWRQATRPAEHPWQWRQDSAGHWYDINLNGAADLPPGEPVMGINQHEAKAYANWVARLGGQHAGAILPHEYQWETAARIGVLTQTGRAWEWCAGHFAPYDQYQAPDDPELATRHFDQQHASLRGGCLHTQRALRRASLRHPADLSSRCAFSGVRLVYPPD